MRPHGASCRIIYVASVDLTEGAGPAVNERESLLALRRLLGDDLFVIAGEPRATDPDLDAIRLDRTLPWGRGRGPLRLLSHQLAKARILRAEVRRLRPSCVIVRLDGLPLGLLLATLGSDVRLVVKTASTSSLRVDPDKHGRLAAALHHRLVRALARKVVGADTITPQRRGIVAGELGLRESRVEVIDNGVNVERFHPVDRSEARRRCGIDPDAVVFGYAGAQAWTRGGRHLIDAAKALRAELAKPLIVIVGGGESIERLRAHARDIGHDDICVFPGLVPYEDVGWWMNTFDVAVSIESGERARREGHAQQKVRQYTAAGVPVVSALGGNAYLAEHDLGSVVDPDDIAAFGEALIRWSRLADRDRADFRQRARTFAAGHLAVEALNEARVDFWRRVGCVGTDPS